MGLDQGGGEGVGRSEQTLKGRPQELLGLDVGVREEGSRMTVQSLSAWEDQLPAAEMWEDGKMNVQQGSCLP